MMKRMLPILSNIAQLGEPIITQKIVAAKLIGC